MPLLPIDFKSPTTKSNASDTYPCCGTFLIYVSKWVEAKATPTNDAHAVIKFVREHIFARFGTQGQPLVIVIEVLTSAANHLRLS